MKNFYNMYRLLIIMVLILVLAYVLYPKYIGDRYVLDGHELGCIGYRITKPMFDQKNILVDKANVVEEAQLVYCIGIKFDNGTRGI